MLLRKRILSSLTFATLAIAASTAAEARVEVGVLRCTIAGGVGYIVGSSKPMSCTFTRRNGPTVSYSGQITKIGVDIGYTRQTRLAWAVLAPTRDVAARALDGRYAGVSAEATLGGGVGANALLGGSGRSVVLQPLSVQAQTGLNIAAGVAGLRLRAVGY
jgi:Protein of unknown function (DUF992)